MAISRRGSVLGLALGGLLGAGGSAVAETRTFAVNWLTDASYYDDTTCPDGLNPSAIDFYRRDLRKLGYSHDEVETALKDFPGEGGLTQPWIPMVTNRGRIDGKAVNIYANPTAQPDPGLKTAQGKYAFGFNLDGRGAASPNSFEDPVTREQGVNSQYFRVMGCVRSYRGTAQGAKPSLPENVWDTLRNQMPAWLITVNAPGGLAKDGDVTVIIDRAVEKITRDANGTDVQPDMTYQIDPDGRSHNVLKAKLVNGVVTTEQANIDIVGDHFIVPYFHFKKAKLRFEMKPDGTMKGLLGGYHPWYDLWYSLANQAHIKEYAASIDLVAVHYALGRMADFDPDPKTGRNRAISMTYAVEGVRAFAVPVGSNKTASR